MTNGDAMTMVSTLVAASGADGWRVALVDQSGLWGLPAGVSEGDESPDDAALRVALAQTGLAARLVGTSPDPPTSVVSESPSVGREGPDGVMRLVFVAVVDSGPSPTPHLRWIGRADLADTGLTVDAREALLRFFPVIADLAAAKNPIQASMVMARVLWSPVVSNPGRTQPLR